MTVPADWLIGRLPFGYLSSTEMLRLDVSYPEPPMWAYSAPVVLPEPPQVSLTLRRFSVVQPLSAETEGTAMDQALRRSGVPALVALADLIAAHRDEYEGLVLSEQVLKSLGSDGTKPH
jgi:hypothetical protein